MSNTTTYKLISMGVLIVLVAGGAVACHYKADSQYVSPSDSAKTTIDTAMVSGAAATPSTEPTAATAKPMTEAKFARGRATVTMPKIYTATEVAPQFPGGQNALDNYINKSVNYPQRAIDDDVTGTIHVSFIIDENGAVTKVKVLDTANVSDGLSQEALRAVKNMPAWTPGTVKGKNVETHLELPITFRLEN
jgi:TonB family protein